MQSEKAIRYRPAIISSNDLNEDTNVKLIHNFGIKDLRDPCKTSKELRLWRNMLSRCYSEKLHAKNPHIKTAQPRKNLKGTLILKTGVKVKLGLVLMTGN